MAVSGSEDRRWWRDDETDALITTIISLNVVKSLDGQRQRNAEVFRRVVNALNERRVFKSLEQVRTKWKSLKKDYITYKRNTLTCSDGSSERPPKFYERMDTLMLSCPLPSIPISQNKSHEEYILPSANDSEGLNKNEIEYLSSDACSEVSLHLQMPSKNIVLETAASQIEDMLTIDEVHNGPMAMNFRQKRKSVPSRRKSEGLAVSNEKVVIEKVEDQDSQSTEETASVSSKDSHCSPCSKRKWSSDDFERIIHVYHRLQSESLDKERAFWMKMLEKEREIAKEERRRQAEENRDLLKTFTEAFLQMRKPSGSGSNT